MVAHPRSMTGCAMTPPLSLRLSAEPHARPIPGIPVGRRPSRRLRRRAAPRPTAPVVAPVVTSFASAKAAPILTPFPFSPVPGLRAALWAPRDWPRLWLGACRYAPGGGGSSEAELHFAFAKYDSADPKGGPLVNQRPKPKSNANTNAESQCGSRNSESPNSKVPNQAIAF